MLTHMRTTLRLSDDVFRAYKQRAAKRGTTFAAEVEAALRADLLARADNGGRDRVKLPIVDGRGQRPTVDLSDNSAVLDMLDADVGYDINKLR